MKNIKAIHIAPTRLMPYIDSRYNKGFNMFLAHKVYDCEFYRETARALKGFKLLDNSFFELGYSLKPDVLVESAALIEATHIVCPDGTKDGHDTFRHHGYKTVAVPKSAEQFVEFMYDEDIALVAVSEEHLDYRHSPGARYELFRDFLKDDMPKKKIHLLGGTDRIAELALLTCFEDHIHSWDSSAAVWHGHLGISLRDTKRKDITSVDFDSDTAFNLFMDNNIAYIEGLLR